MLHCVTRQPVLSQPVSDTVGQVHEQGILQGLAREALWRDRMGTHQHQAQGASKELQLNKLVAQAVLLQGRVCALAAAC